MTDYKTIFGKNIRLQTSDLTMSTATEGELFYSATDNEFKVGVNLNAWSAGGNLNNDHANWASSTASPQDAVVGVGGGPPGLLTEEYNGSTWANGENAPEKLEAHAGAGTLTAGLFFGGQVPASDTPGPAPQSQAETFEYDGTDYTDTGNMNTDRQSLSGCGTQTAGLGFGGRTISPSNDPGNINVNTEEYNGSSWTESGNLSTGRMQGSAFGIQTAAVYAQGRSMPGGAGSLNLTEEYNGSTWSSGENFPEVRVYNSAAGILTAGIIFAGKGGTFPGTTRTTTFTYDGTDYAASAAMGTGRYLGAGSGGTQGAALMAGGPPDEDATAEFGTTVTLKPVTDS